MLDLKGFLEQCSSAGVVVRNPEFALNTLGKTDVSESQKVLQVFEQGISLGTQLYVDKASFSMDKFGVLLGRFGISGDAAKQLIANLRPEPPIEAHKQEIF